VSEADWDKVDDLHRIVQIATACGIIVTAVIARLVGLL
jgi:hypothetical protein